MYGGGSSSVEGAEGMERNNTKIAEEDGMGRENREGNGGMIVTGRNQGYGSKDKDGMNSKNVDEILNGRETVIVDPKRRRVDSGIEEKNDGLENMQTDGLIVTNKEADPKNLQLAGPVDQARLEL